MERSTILIVDDSEENLSLLERLLEPQGYDVVTVDSGERALRHVRTQPPDLIILDVMMPGMNGFEVCERLKSDPHTEHIPIIFISTVDQSDVIVKAFEVGGVDYISRPFRQNEVLARVRSQLTVVQQRKRIETLLQRERQQFEDITQMKNQFFGAATHDIKNPLLIILGYVALMETQDEIINNKVGAEGLAGIRKGIDRISRLIRDMLDLVQMESSVNLSLSEVSLATYIKECLQGFEVLADQKDIQLRYSPPMQDRIIRLDKKRMKRAIDNLVSNAIKYTPPHGHVTVNADCLDDEVVIEIRDTGIGIPSESIPHLFETFYRVPHDAHQEIDGTGLGLAVVQAIIEQHNGDIEVESQPGQGSTFRVYLSATL